MQEALFDAAEGLAADVAGGGGLGGVVVVAEGAGGWEGTRLEGFLQAEEVLDFGLLFGVDELQLAGFEALEDILGFEIQQLRELHGLFHPHHHPGIPLPIIQQNLQIMPIDIPKNLPLLRQYPHLHLPPRNQLQPLHPHKLRHALQHQIPHQLHNPRGAVRVVLWHVVGEGVADDEVEV